MATKKIEIIIDRKIFFRGKLLIILAHKLHILLCIQRICLWQKIEDNFIIFFVNLRKKEKQ